MPVLAVYNQTFSSSLLATYSWTFQFQRVMKTKPNSRFIIRLNQAAAATSGITPATSNNQLNLYLYSPELCGAANHILYTPTGTITNNEVLLGGSNNLVFLCNDFPASPVNISYKYTTTYITPTAGNYVFFLNWTIYEIDGDIPDSVIR